MAMRVLRKTLCASFACLLLTVGGGLAAEPFQQPQVFAQLGGVRVLGTGSHYGEIALGAFDLRGASGSSKRSAAADVELRIGEKLGFVGPALGLVANTDGGVFGYGGVYAELAYGNVVVMPLLGLGGYRQGNSSDLGGAFQFRLSLGIAYQFAGGSRLGVKLTHISNAGIHDYNPGEEELYLSYALPF